MNNLLSIIIYLVLLNKNTSAMMTHRGFSNAIRRRHRKRTKRIRSLNKFKDMKRLGAFKKKRVI